MGTAIVAIPREDDYVWKLSSEKVPHMTLLYLGDLTDPAKISHIVQYVEHAVKTSLVRFGLNVDRRGELGPDKADVLFFKGWGLPKVEQFRSHLLKDLDIFMAHASASQYEGWTPHLTMGYPTSPAKKDPRDYPGTSFVSFDRIAVWTGNYEGPTFDIPSDEDLWEVAMSDSVDSVLAHFGVKGMKWGIRKNKPSKITSTDAQRAKDAQDIIKKHGTQALDNKDLQHLVTRMNLERQYNNVMASNPGKVKKGYGFVKDLIGVAKTGQDVYNLVNSPMSKAVGSAIAKEAGKHHRPAKGATTTIRNKGSKQTVSFS